MTNPIELESLQKEGPLEIRCHRCKRCMARAVRVLDDSVKLGTEVESPVVPVGCITTSHRLFKELGEHSNVDREGFIANREDLAGAKDGGVRQGCCGPDGADGPNLFCPCGHQIGTEFGDCSMPHFVSLSANWIDICPVTWGVKGPDEQ